jgi:quinol monooxygenase YgiN
MSDAGVIVIGEMHGLVGRHLELEQVLGELAGATREDPDCLGYHVASLQEPGEYLIVVTWRHEAALRAHYSTAAYARYRGAVGELLARPSDVVVHRVSSTVHARDPNPPEPGMLG